MNSPLKRSLLRFVAKPALAAALLFVPTGCWSKKDLGQLTVVSAIGLDMAPDNRISVTVQLINPTLPVAAGGSSSSRRPFALYSSESESVYDALEKIRQQAKKAIFLPQTRAVLIGEQLARRGIEHHLDYFWRDNQQNLTTWVIVTEQTARSALENSQELEEVSSDEWKRYLNSKQRMPNSSAIKMYEFIPRFKLIGMQAYAPGLFFVSQDKDEAIRKIGQTAVFKSGKMVGWLSEQETQAAQWMTGRSRIGTLRYGLPGSAAGKIQFELGKLRVRFVPEVSDERVIVRIHVKGKAGIKETARHLDLSNPEELGKLTQSLNDEVSELIANMVRKVCRTYNSDMLGIGERIHQRQPEQWKKLQSRWSEELLKLEPRVSADMTVIHVGSLRSEY